MEALITAVQQQDASSFVACIKNIQTSSGDGTADLQTLKELLSESTKIVNNLLINLVKAEVQEIAGLSDSDTFLELPEAQFFEPRGRFKTTMSMTGIHLEGKTASCFVPWCKVTHIVTFPAYQTTKKEGEDIMAIRIEPATVKYNGKDLNTLLWNCGKSLGKPIKSANDSCPVDGIESHVVSTLLAHLWGKELTRPRPDLFQTIAIKDPKPYLKCYKGTQEGAIYPLDCGVVFIKPTLFLPAEDIASITAGRGGGSGQTRYIDLKIVTADDREFEFTNIERDELPALQGYVKGYLEMRAKAEEEARRAAGGEDMDDDDSDEEDDDFDPDASDSNGSSGSDTDSDSDASGGDDDDDDEDDEDSEEENGTMSNAHSHEDGGSKGKKCKIKWGKANRAEKATVTSKDKEGKINSPKKERGEKKHKKVGSSDSKVATASTEEDDADALLRAAYQSSFQGGSTSGQQQGVKRPLPTATTNNSASSVLQIKTEESSNHIALPPSPKKGKVDEAVVGLSVGGSVHVKSEVEVEML
jgi:hypothetical protein